MECRKLLFAVASLCCTTSFVFISATSNEREDLANMIKRHANVMNEHLSSKGALHDNRKDFDGDSSKDLQDLVRMHSELMFQNTNTNTNTNTDTDTEQTTGIVDQVEIAADGTTAIISGRRNLLHIDGIDDDHSDQLSNENDDVSVAAEHESHSSESHTSSHHSGKSSHNSESGSSKTSKSSHHSRSPSTIHAITDMPVSNSPSHNNINESHESVSSVSSQSSHDSSSSSSSSSSESSHDSNSDVDDSTLDAPIQHYHSGTTHSHDIIIGKHPDDVDPTFVCTTGWVCECDASMDIFEDSPGVGVSIMQGTGTSLSHSHSYTHAHKLPFPPDVHDDNSGSGSKSGKSGGSKSGGSSSSSSSSSDGSSGGSRRRRTHAAVPHSHGSYSGHSGSQYDPYEFHGQSGSTKRLWVGGTPLQRDGECECHCRAESPTVKPTPSPTVKPTSQPTPSPSVKPTLQPTSSPTIKPTQQPTTSPTAQPTRQPTLSPTVESSSPPTVSPSSKPSLIPSQSPTFTPTMLPSPSPSSLPTIYPSVATFPPNKSSLLPNQVAT